MSNLLFVVRKLTVFVCPPSIRNDVGAFKLPRDIDDAKALGRVLSKYKDTHFFTVMGGVVVTYVLYPNIKLLNVLSSVVCK